MTATAFNLSAMVDNLHYLQQSLGKTGNLIYQSMPNNAVATDKSQKEGLIQRTYDITATLYQQSEPFSMHSSKFVVIVLRVIGNF